MDELLEYLLDVEEYSLPKVTKPRRSRGAGMKLDRIMYGYGTSTKAVLYSGLYDASSPIREELSREGLQFRLDYGVRRMTPHSQRWPTPSHQHLSHQRCSHEWHCSEQLFLSLLHMGALHFQKFIKYITSMQTWQVW
jgi:hypothetical protein